MRQAAALLALALALSAAAARAEPAEPSPIQAVNNSLSLSFLRSNIYYIEPGNIRGGNYFDYEKGHTSGGKLALSLMGRLDIDNVYFHADYGASEGKIAYTGYLQGGAAYIPYTGTSRATTQEGNLRLGKGFELGRRWMATPFLGGGRRYWVRELSVGQPIDFVETYDFLYYGGGAMVQWNPLQRLVLTVDGLVGKTDGATIRAGFPGLTGLVLNRHVLGSSTYQRYEGEVDYGLWKFLHAFAALDYVRFNFGASAPSAAGVFEPFSKTTVYNYTLGLRLTFENWHPLTEYQFGQ